MPVLVSDCQLITVAMSLPALPATRASIPLKVDLIMMPEGSDTGLLQTLSRHSAIAGGLL